MSASKQELETLRAQVRAMDELLEALLKREEAEEKTKQLGLGAPARVGRIR